MKIKNLVICGTLISSLMIPTLVRGDSNCIAYKVKRGDTLGKIAKRYGITVEVLGDINQIKNYDNIFEGETLIIPMNGTTAQVLQNQDTLSYVVSKGDTLGKIANRFGTTVEELIRINNIKNKDKIYEGQVIRLVGKSSYREPAKENSSSHLSNGGAYRVQKGDTLAKISKRLWGKNYGVLLQNYLGLSDDEVKNMQIGEILYLPSESELLAYQSVGHKENHPSIVEPDYVETPNDYIDGNVAYHVVRKGENLTKIVCYYYRAEDVHANNLVELVAEYNGLENKNDIRENDVIRIPLTYENSRLRGNVKQKTR